MDKEIFSQFTSHFESLKIIPEPENKNIVKQQ